MIKVLILEELAIIDKRLQLLIAVAENESYYNLKTNLQGLDSELVDIVSQEEDELRDIGE